MCIVFGLWNVDAYTYTFSCFYWCQYVCMYLYFFSSSLFWPNKMCGVHFVSISSSIPCVVLGLPQSPTPKITHIYIYERLSNLMNSQMAYIWCVCTYWKQTKCTQPFVGRLFAYLSVGRKKKKKNQKFCLLRSSQERLLEKYVLRTNKKTGSS